MHVLLLADRHKVTNKDLYSTGPYLFFVISDLYN